MNFTGRPVEVRFLPSLRVSRRRLAPSGRAGVAVHAATFIRARLILLDSALRRDTAERDRILVHELFHFVWVRLSNGAREGWERVLEDEFRERIAGELGWSAESRKERFFRGGFAARSRAWREYACESFCDTAAWLYGSRGRHPEFTLPPAARIRRRRWFSLKLDEDALPI